MENEWTKVVIKFEQKISLRSLEDGQMPRNKTDSQIDNKKVEVKMFGTYTILVHSISMLIVTTMHRKRSVNFKMSFLCQNFFQKPNEIFSRISALPSKKRSNQISSVTRQNKILQLVI